VQKCCNAKNIDNLFPYVFKLLLGQLPPNGKMLKRSGPLPVAMLRVNQAQSVRQLRLTNRLQFFRRYGKA
jgi:hypothetical protein